MATERRDRGTGMQTKTKITRDRDWPNEAESVLEGSDARVALERRDRGTGMQTKTKITRDREWPKEMASTPQIVSAVKDRGPKMVTKTKPVRNNREWPKPKARSVAKRAPKSKPRKSAVKARAKRKS
jgi:hypothetical protein